MASRNPKPTKFYTICGFRYEECDDAFPITSSAAYNTPEEAYPAVVKIVNDTIDMFDDGFGNAPAHITEADCNKRGYELSEDKYHLNVIIQEHSLP